MEMVALRMATNVAPSWVDDAAFVTLEVQSSQRDDGGGVPASRQQYRDSDLYRPALAAMITAEAERMSTHQASKMEYSTVSFP